MRRTRPTWNLVKPGPRKYAYDENCGKCGKYGHRTDSCKMDCDKPECGGLFKYPKRAPSCVLNPANLKRPADAPRAGNVHHRAQEADGDDDSEADANEADESYLPDTDGANSIETFFNARETPSKFAFFDARPSLHLSPRSYRKRHRRKQIAAAKAAAQAPPA